MFRNAGKATPRYARLAYVLPRDREAPRPEAIKTHRPSECVRERPSAQVCWDFKEVAPANLMYSANSTKSYSTQSSHKVHDSFATLIFFHLEPCRPTPPVAEFGPWTKLMRLIFILQNQAKLQVGHEILKNRGSLEKNLSIPATSSLPCLLLQSRYDPIVLCPLTAWRCRRMNRVVHHYHEVEGSVRGLA